MNRSSQKPVRCVLPLLAGGLLLAASHAPAAPVVAPDDGTGSISWPIPNEPLTNGTRVRKGMQDLKNIAAEIQLEVRSLKNISATSVPGGNLGGERHTGTATAVVGFDNGQTSNPDYQILVSFVGDSGPTINPGGDQQSFDINLVRVEGMLPPGDPDFDLLSVQGGTDFGFPGAGKVHLSRLGPPGSDFAVETFFDTEFRVDWQGSIGGALNGLGGSNTNASRLEQPLRALDGLVFDPEGQATTILTPDGLQISNIGSSGLDGVVINDLPFASQGSKKGYDYYMARVAQDPSGSLLSNSGDELVIRAEGEASDPTTIQTRCENTLSAVDITMDVADLGATKCAVGAFNNGQLVATAELSATETMAAIPPADFDLERILARTVSPPLPNFVPTVPGTYVFQLKLRTPKPIVLGPQTAMINAIADEIVIFPTDQTIRAGKLKILQFNSAKMSAGDTITLTGLEFGQFELPFRGLGEAVVAPTDRGGLHISNIGSSGQDGVSIDLGPGFGSQGRGLEMDLAPIDVVGPGGSIRVQARDSFDNPLGHLEYGAPGVLTADYSPLGSSIMRVEVLDDGSLAGSHDVPLVTGQVATVGTANLTGCGTNPGLLPLQCPYFFMTFDRDTTITPTTGAPLVGDEVRVRAVDPAPSALHDWSFGVVIPFRVTDVEGDDARIVVQYKVKPGTDSTDPNYPASDYLDKWLPMVGNKTVSLDGGAPPPVAGTVDFLPIEIHGYTPLPGPGPLGGDLYQADLFLHASGQGSLAGLERDLVLPVQLEVQPLGTSFAGEVIQRYPSELLSLQAEIVGDPDFDFLRIQAGANFGLPSPGETTVTRFGQAGTSFVLDSSFDVEFRIEFQGAPGSLLTGFNENSVHRDRWEFTRDSLLFDGLVHSGLGQAQLSLNGSGHLVVSNIGSSGLDGVSIELPDVEGLELELTPFLLNPGESLLMSAQGDLPGLATDVDFGFFLAEATPTGEYQATYNFSVLGTFGATGARMEVLDNGLVVATASSGLIDTIQIEPVAPGPPPRISLLGRLPARGAGPGMVTRFADPAIFTLPGQPPVQGSDIRIVTRPILVPVYPLRSVGLKTDIGAPLEINETAPILFGRRFYLVDRSRPTGYSGPPKSSFPLLGTDDVTISPVEKSASPPASPPPPLGLRLTDMQPLRIDGSMRFEPRGSLGGVADSSLGVLDLQYDASGNLQVISDFSSRGATQARLQVFASSNAADRLNPVLDTILPDGLVATIPKPPSDLAAEIVKLIAGAHEEDNVALEMGKLIETSLPGGPTVTGRYIEISPIAPTNPPDTIEAVTLSTDGMRDGFLTDVFTGPLPTQGLQHTSLGGAELTTNGSGHLVVSNIGSSGLDGVSIDVSQSEGARFVAPYDPWTDIGNLICTEVCEGVDDDCDGEVDEDFSDSIYLRGTLRTTQAAGGGSGGRISVKCESDKSPLLPLRIYTWDENGDLTHWEDFPQGDAGELFPDPGPTVPFRAWEYLPPKIGPTGSDGCGFGYHFLLNVNYTSPTGVTVPCQRLEVRVQDPTALPYNQSDWDFVVRLVGPAELTFTEEALGVFRGNEATSEGEAQLTTRGGHLTVSNIGSSGLDGVSIDLDPVQTEEFVWLQEIPYAPAPVPPQDVPTIRVTPRDSFGNPVGTVRADFAEAIGAPVPGAEVRADFSALGTTQAHVYLLSGGAIVHDYVHVNPLADPVTHIHRLSPSGLVGVGGFRTWPLPGFLTPPGIVLTFNAPVECTPPGVPPGSGFLCEEVRITAEGVAPGAGLGGFGITSTVERLTLTGTTGVSFPNWVADNFNAAEIAQLAAANYRLDLDGDGGDEIEEYLVQSNPHLGDYHERSPFGAVEVGGDGLKHLRHTYQLAPVGGIEVLLFRTEDLQIFDWNQGQFQLLQAVPLPNGNTRFTYELITPIGHGGKLREFIGHDATVR